MGSAVTPDKNSFFSKQNLPDLVFWCMAIVLLFLNLGVKGISGSEARWTGIVREMFLSGNFVQPTINFELYFDKPIVSYWFIALFAFFNKGVATELVARIPSALAALAALWATRVIAFRLWSREVAVTASWIFLTIYSLAFWGRLAEADMLNMAFGTLAIAWYIVKRDKTDVFSYFVFGALCAIGGQTKGLSAIAIPVLVVLTDLIVNNTWKRHLNWRLFAAGFLSLLVYFLPFFLVATKSNETFMNGLYLVFRENITRFFDPFDHKGPWYDYFKYLPQLFTPWTPFLVLAFAWACKEWKRLSGDERWLLVSNIVIFTVFSLSGSKRVYYILPILPFCALLTALYLCRKENGFWEQIKVILLKVYEWVFFIAGFILLAAPLIWHFVKRMLPFEFPPEINTFIYAFPIPLGILFLFIFIYFRKQNPSGTKWDFCGSSSFTRAAVSCAVLMIFVFGIAIPVFDVTLRTGKPFMLEAAQKMKAAGIDRANVAFPVKTYTTLTYYLSYPQHIPVLAEEHEEKDLDKALAGFFAAAGTTPVAVIAELRDWQRVRDPLLRKTIQDNIFMVEPLMKWEKKKDRRKKYVIVALNVSGPDRGKIQIFQ